MEIPHDDDRLANLRWKRTAVRSKPPPPPSADEINTAESLLLLALSGGGFCNPALLKTVPRPNYRGKKHRKISPSAASNVEKQEELSPNTPLQDSWDSGQVFQTFQALDAHMAAVSDDRNRRNSAVHECSICHERFATGQALGGHKRKHYDGPPLTGKSCHERSAAGQSALGGHKRKHCEGSALTGKATKIKFIFPKRSAEDSGGESSGGGATTTTRDDRPVFEFDLNMPPPPED